MKEAPIIIVLLLMLSCIIVCVYQINENVEMIENQAEIIDSMTVLNQKSFQALKDCNGFLKQAVETNSQFSRINELQREQIYYLSQKH